MTGNCLVRFRGGEASLKNVDLSRPFIIGGLLSVILLMQTVFSSSITRPLQGYLAMDSQNHRWPFKKSFTKSWNNDKPLTMNYPWFQKNTPAGAELRWPSISQLSYVNSEMKSEDTFLKTPQGQNKMYFAEKSESVVEPSNSIASHILYFLSKTNVSFSKQVDLYKHAFSDSNSRVKELQAYPSETMRMYPKPLEDLKPPGGEITNGLGQQTLELNWGFPSFKYRLEGPSKMQKKNFYIILDNLSYRMMGIGFPLFTLGILSGAVWANEAWGSYWSWDIKEVGSFINWLLVALYFHCRYKNFILLSHIVAFLSLMVLFFNFFGISLGIFGSSLHAYGASS